MYFTWSADLSNLDKREESCFIVISDEPSVTSFHIAPALSSDPMIQEEIS